MSATIGHNQPAPPTPEEVNAYLTETCADLITRRDEILAGIERFKTQYPTIPDADIQGKAADFAGRNGAIARFDKLVEARRVTAKQPYDHAAAAAQTFFKTTVLAQIVAGRAEIIRRMNVFADALAEKQRKEAEEAAAKAAAAAREAEEKAMASLSTTAIDDATSKAREAEAAQKHAESRHTGHVVGSMGGSAGLTTRYRLNEEQSDLLELAKAVVAGTAPLKYLAFHSVNIGIAIRSEGVRQIPGCQIDEVRSV